MPEIEMAAKIAFILTSQDQLGSSGYRTGSWLEELAQPYCVFTRAGCEIVLASIEGGAAPIDPMSLDDAWVSEVGRGFMQDATAQQALAATRRVDEISASDFDAVFVVGGAGGAWDFTGHAGLNAFIEGIDRKGGVIGAICHGALVLAEIKGADGMPLVRGRPVTAVSNAEEALAGFDKIVPILPEETLKRACGIYMAAPPFAPNVVQDGDLFTGQNPASAPGLAEAMLARLTQKQAA
jgi:putative intracellular protease/amidase